jgi:hypothetical protein
MITVTLLIEGSQQQTIFYKRSLIIGSGTPDLIDICLAILPLQTEHVKVIEDNNGSFTIINQANDPFVSLNGLPFHKKKLQEGDILQIHSVEIKIDKLTPSFEGPSNDNNISNSLEKRIHKKKTEYPLTLEEIEQLFAESSELNEKLDDSVTETVFAENSSFEKQEGYSIHQQVGPNKGQAVVGWVPIPHTVKERQNSLNSISARKISPYLWKETAATAILIISFATALAGIQFLFNQNTSLPRGVPNQNMETKILIPGVQIAKKENIYQSPLGLNGAHSYLEN